MGGGGEVRAFLLANVGFLFLELMLELLRGALLEVLDEWVVS